MIVSPDILRRNTLGLLQQIEVQIDEVKEEAKRMGIPPEKLRNYNGEWAMSPLLLAKAQVYSTLVLLQAKK